MEVTNLRQIPHPMRLTLRQLTPLHLLRFDYTRKPADILSNSWSDTNSANSTASNTTVNTAIIAGIVPSGNGYYSGGAENFPRFLENWGGKTLTYYGSMIEKLYKSEQGYRPLGRSQCL